MTIYEEVFLWLILTIALASASMSLNTWIAHTKTRRMLRVLAVLNVLSIFLTAFSFVMIFVVWLRR